MSQTIRDQAPKHPHSRAQNKALRACVVCMNVTVHKVQCPGAAECGATFYHEGETK